MYSLNRIKRFDNVTVMMISPVFGSSGNDFSNDFSALVIMFYRCLIMNNSPVVMVVPIHWLIHQICYANASAKEVIILDLVRA